MVKPQEYFYDNIEIYEELYSLPRLHPRWEVVMIRMLREYNELICGCSHPKDMLLKQANGQGVYCSSCGEWIVKRS